jgi:hypothetical protein
MGTDGYAHERAWYPDLRTREVNRGAGVMVRF